MAEWITPVRMLPPMKDLHVQLDLLPIERLADASVAAEDVTELGLDEQRTPSLGHALRRVVEIQRRALERKVL